MADMIPQTGSQPRFATGSHETSADVSLGSILGVATAIGILCVVSAGFIAGVMSYAQVGHDRELAHRPALLNRTKGLYGEAGPAVRGENPVSDYRRDPGSVPELRDSELAVGDSAYGWVEPGKVARLPVSRAISILAEKDALPQFTNSSSTTDLTPSDAVRRAIENPAPQRPVPTSTKGQ